MKPSGILEHARSFVEQGWCQYGHAKNKHGDDVHYSAPDATCFCAIGAIKRAHEIDKKSDKTKWRFEDYQVAMVLLADASGARSSEINGSYDTIALWNDSKGQTQAGVLAGFDRAIQEAKSENR